MDKWNISSEHKSAGPSGALRSTRPQCPVLDPSWNPLSSFILIFHPLGFHFLICKTGIVIPTHWGADTMMDLNGSG